MGWSPLVTGPRRQAIQRVVREIVEAVDQAPDADPWAAALLHAYVEQEEVVPDPENRGGAALARAVAALASEDLRPALFGGLAGVGWLVAHLADGVDADAVCTTVDAAIARQLETWSGTYDLIGGVVGFGVYALERGNEALATRVLEHLASRARPRAGGRAWHTDAALLPANQRAIAPAGYWNLGVAHGAAGVIALLARFVAAGLPARELHDAAVASFLAVEPPNASGRYPAWHAVEAPAIAEQRGRLAWCYNDLGIAIALLSSAREEALALGRACAARSISDAAVKDPALCHGAIGAAHLFDRLRQATGESIFADAAVRWLDHALAMPHDADVDTSLLNGTTGIALVLHSMISEVEPSWDRLLFAEP